MNTVVVAVKIAYRALMSRHGLNVHVHHHHWYHTSEEPEDNFTDERVKRRQSMTVQQKFHFMGTETVTIDGPPAQISELPDYPAPAPCELPVYFESTDAPSEANQKPVFRFRLSEPVT